MGVDSTLYRKHNKVITNLLDEDHRLCQIEWKWKWCYSQSVLLDWQQYPQRLNNRRKRNRVCIMSLAAGLELMVVNRYRAKGSNEEDGEKEREMKGDVGRESAGEKEIS